MDALDCLKTRRSVRSYTAEPVSESAIRDIIDAGRLAATAKNEQPWEFVVVTESAMREKLASIMTYGKFIAEAPVCIVVLSRDSKHYIEDGSAATQNILLAAHALGLGSCWVAGCQTPYADGVCQLLEAPAGYRLVSAIAIGHSNSTAHKPLKRSGDEVVHWERF